MNGWGTGLIEEMTIKIILKRSLRKLDIFRDGNHDHIEKKSKKSGYI